MNFIPLYDKPQAVMLLNLHKLNQAGTKLIAIQGADLLARAIASCAYEIKQHHDALEAQTQLVKMRLYLNEITNKSKGIHANNKHWKTLARCHAQLNVCFKTIDRVIERFNKGAK